MRFILLYIMFFYIILISNSSYALFCAPEGFPNPDSSVSLEMVAYDPVNNRRSLSSISQVPTIDAEQRCSDLEAKRHGNIGIDFTWTSFDTICTIAGYEGRYKFELIGTGGASFGSASVCQYINLDVRWDSMHPSGRQWCIQASCGRGDWLGSSIVSNNCCSPRTMNLADYTYTNEDCNVIIGNNLCYFRENATLVEPSTAGRWLKASDFTGEIVYEECG
ncbi:MAG: hypothetical protein ACMXYG_05530, partial [Candidatus Woesearchaeota archaeon]